MGTDAPFSADQDVVVASDIAGRTIVNNRPAEYGVEKKEGILADLAIQYVRDHPVTDVVVPTDDQPAKICYAAVTERLDSSIRTPAPPHNTLMYDRAEVMN